jgi:hypothetical protein
MGAETPPGLLDQAIMKACKAGLPPAILKGIAETMNEKGEGGGEGGGGEAQPKSADPFKAAGNPVGGIDMGSAG